MGAWLQEGIVPIDAGARSPRPARRLSIEATFTLIAAINGIVLAYLLATALRVLRVSGAASGRWWCRSPSRCCWRCWRCSPI